MRETASSWGRWHRGAQERGGGAGRGAKAGPRAPVTLGLVASRPGDERAEREKEEGRGPQLTEVLQCGASQMQASQGPAGTPGVLTHAMKRPCTGAKLASLLLETEGVGVYFKFFC